MRHINIEIDKTKFQQDIYKAIFEKVEPYSFTITINCKVIFSNKLTYYLVLNFMSGWLSLMYDELSHDFSSKENIFNFLDHY